MKTTTKNHLIVKSRLSPQEAAFGDFTVSVRQELAVNIITGHMSNSWRILLTLVI